MFEKNKNENFNMGDSTVYKFWHRRLWYSFILPHWSREYEKSKCLYCLCLQAEIRLVIQNPLLSLYLEKEWKIAASLLKYKVEVVSIRSNKKCQKKLFQGLKNNFIQVIRDRLISFHLREIRKIKNNSVFLKI